MTSLRAGRAERRREVIGSRELTSLLCHLSSFHTSRLQLQILLLLYLITLSSIYEPPSSWTPPIPLQEHKSGSSNHFASTSFSKANILDDSFQNSFDQSQVGEESQSMIRMESQNESQLNESQMESQSQDQGESQDTAIESQFLEIDALPKKRKRKSLPAKRWSGLGGGGSSSFSWDPRSSLSADKRRKKDEAKTTETIETSVEALSQRVKTIMDRLCLIGMISDNGLGLNSLFEDESSQLKEAESQLTSTETQPESQSQSQSQSQLDKPYSSSAVSGSKEPLLFGSSSRPKESVRDDRDEMQWLCSDLVEPFFSSHSSTSGLCEIMRGKCFVPSTTPARPRVVRNLRSEEDAIGDADGETADEAGSKRNVGSTRILSRSSSFPSTSRSNSDSNLESSISSTPNLQELSVTNQNRKIQASRKALESLPNFSDALKLEKVKRETSERKKWEDERLKLKETMKLVGDGKKERKLKRTESLGVGSVIEDGIGRRSTRSAPGTGIGNSAAPRISKRKTEARKLPINLGAPFSTSVYSNLIKARGSSFASTSNQQEDSRSNRQASFDSKSSANYGRTSVLASPQQSQGGGIGIGSKALARGRNLTGIRRSESQPNPRILLRDEDEELDQANQINFNSDISMESNPVLKRKILSLSDSEEEEEIIRAPASKQRSFSSSTHNSSFRNSISTSLQQPSKPGQLSSRHSSVAPQPASTSGTSLPLKKRSAFTRSESQPVNASSSRNGTTGSVVPGAQFGGTSRSKDSGTRVIKSKSESQPNPSLNSDDDEEELETFKSKANGDQDDEEDEAIIVPRSRKSFSSSLSFPWTNPNSSLTDSSQIESQSQSQNGSRMDLDDEDSLDSSSVNLQRPFLNSSRSELTTKSATQIETSSNITDSRRTTTTHDGGIKIPTLNRAPSGRNPFAAGVKSKSVKSALKPQTSSRAGTTSQPPTLVHSNSAPALPSRGGTSRGNQPDSDSLPLKGRKKVRLSPEIVIGTESEMTSPAELGRNWRAGRSETLEEGGRN